MSTGMDIKILKQNSIGKDLAATAIFNTLIALVLKFWVLKENLFLDIWIVSQCIGLSICFLIVMTLSHTQINTKKQLFLKITIGLITGAISGAAIGALFLYFKYDKPFFSYFQSSFNENFLLGVFFAIPITYFLLSLAKFQDYETQLQTEKIKRLTLEKQSVLEELKMLQAQIEPHFLFNTLSNLKSLLEEDVKKGKLMLDELNGFLKISLQRTRQETISLSQELELVKHYLNIYKIRMEERLVYEIIADKEIKNISLSPLIIQPLVENAIKYGLEPKIEGGKIKIKCSIKDNFLIIEIADTGCGLDTNSEIGIGINNVSQRLNNLYGSEAKLTVKENSPCGTKAVIKVPL
ncbi:MAG: histidine kinase [Desulfobacteraceae bacterium]|nr:histidine kinase [Desulfobacteraceae bacterium]